MKYLLGVIATVFVLIAAIFWIRSDSPTDKKAETDNKVSLVSYADGSAKVSYELHGELVGDEERQSIRITVDRNQRVFEILDGYNKKVVSTKTFANNAAAFDEFVHGLAIAGFAATQEARFESEKGVCPKGNVAIYTVVDKGDEVSRLWSGSCNKKAGSFAGNRRLVEDLFEDQIPEFRELTRDVEL